LYQIIVNKFGDFIRGYETMTVATQVKQTLAGLKSAQASFETFALQTENEQAKQFYQNAAQQTQQLVDSLNTRVQQIQQEEPQYSQQ
jgi:hypothetical protein